MMRASSLRIQFTGSVKYWTNTSQIKLTYVENGLICGLYNIA